MKPWSTYLPAASVCLITARGGGGLAAFRMVVYSVAAKR